MTKSEIIESIAKSKLVALIVLRIGWCEYSDDIADLELDIYELLLSKPDEFIELLHERGELAYWIVNVVYTNIRSTTSPYYRNYKRFRLKSVDLDNLKQTLLQK